MRWGMVDNPILQMSTLRLKKCRDLPEAFWWGKGYFPPLCDFSF